MDSSDERYPRVDIGLVHKTGGQSTRLVELRGWHEVIAWFGRHHQTQVDAGTYSAVYLSWATAAFGGSFLCTEINSRAWNRHERWSELNKFLDELLALDN